MWPGYDASDVSSIDTDEGWILMSDSASLADSALVEALTEYEEHECEFAARRLQAVARGRIAKHEVARRRAATVYDVPICKDLGMKINCLIASFFAAVVLYNSTAATTAPAALRPLLLSHSGSVLPMQDEHLSWQAIDFQRDSMRSLALSTLGNTIMSFEVQFDSLAALPPPLSGSLPAMHASWLPAPPVPSVPPDHEMVITSLSARDSASPPLYEMLFIALLALTCICLKLSGLVLVSVMTPELEPACTRASLMPEAATTPSVTSATKLEHSTPMATPVTLSWNAFQASVSKKGHTKADISQMYKEYKTPQTGSQQMSPNIGIGTGNTHFSAASAAGLTTPTNLHAAFESSSTPFTSISERPSTHNSSTQTSTMPLTSASVRSSAPLNWNELQRLTGEKGFTKEQMSLIWAAHKVAAPMSYQQFRTQCKCRGIDRKVESAMWVQLKLCRASRGLRAERVVH